jgi:nitroreductase
VELLEGLKTRKSIRAFRTDPVPRDVLTEVLETARWSPSWGNTQPWELVVVEGEKVKQITGELVAAYEKKNPPNPDIAMPATFPDAYKTRYMACASGLFGTMGIARDDKASRLAHYGEDDRGVRCAGHNLRHLPF